MEIKSTYLVDSHCHLNFQDFNDDFEQVLLRAEESNVKIMVSISTELDEIEKIIKISEKYSNIYCTVGVHPHSTNKLEDMINILEESNKKDISIIVGPEGGFSSSEIALCNKSNCFDIGLGPRILRTETAPIVITSILQSIYGDF